MSLTIDSFAWVEIIRGSRLGTESRRLVGEADACWTPAGVLAEVAHWCLRDGLDENTVRRELRGMGESSTIVPIDPELAIGGSRAQIELRERARAMHLPVPGLGDGLVLATARALRSRVLTGDPHFRGLRETLWLE
ncbi:MAG: PIN domain-containing protein [Thermoplasmata archaeon]|nr:PIN domain-containing protein [Thermoplasmata archaeon]